MLLEGFKFHEAQRQSQLTSWSSLLTYLQYALIKTCSLAILTTLCSVRDVWLELTRRCKRFVLINRPEYVG